MAYRNNSNKFWTGFLAVLLVLVIAGAAALVGVLSDGFKNWDKFKTDEEQAEQTEETADNGAPVTDENGNELESDAAIPMPKAMTFRSAAALDGTSAAYDSVTLTATVKPDVAANKAVDWSIAFVNPSSTWANGKTVTDYVTVTPTSDGATTATVKCLKDFGEQIKITVTSRDNENATASCTVDFRKRIVDIAYIDEGTDFTISEDNIITVSNVKMSTQGFNGSSFDCTYSAFTVDDTSYALQDYVMNISDSFYQAMLSEGLTSRRDSSEPYSALTIAPATVFSFWVNEFASITIGFGEAFNQYVRALQSVNEDVIGTIKVSFVGDNATFEKIYSVKVLSSALVFSVTGIDLDESNVII